MTVVVIVAGVSDGYTDRGMGDPVDYNTVWTAADGTAVVTDSLLLVGQDHRCNLCACFGIL